MKNSSSFLFFVIVLLFSCGMESKTIAKDGGVQLKISGVGATTAAIFNKRLTSVFPSGLSKLNNDILEIEIPELVSSTLIKNMVSGQGLVHLKPSVGSKLTLDKENIDKVELVNSSSTGESQISIAMNSAAAKKWADMTRQNIDKTIEIYVDENLISAPMVNSPITGGRTSVVGKNELATKMLFSIINFPSTNPSNIIITSHSIFVKNEDGIVQEVPSDLIEKYEVIRRTIAQNKVGILDFVQRIETLKPNAKSMLLNDINRIIESDVETYLLETKVNIAQFNGIMDNVLKLFAAYKQGRE